MNEEQALMPESHLGTLKDVVFRQEDFLIGYMETDNRERIKIKGSLYGVEKGEEITIKGKWETHPKYGRQFAVETWERPIPQTKEQVIAFLASPLVKGCGPKQAVMIFEKLGENAIDIISEEGESCLEGIKGIGPKRRNKIVESVRSTFEVQKVISELLVYGITAEVAMKAYKEFGPNAAAIILENPYELIKLDNIGFLKADEIARKIGKLPISSFRIDACMEFVLTKTCYSSGHCYVEEHELFKQVELALNHHSTGDDIVTMEEIEQSVLRLDGDTIVIDEDGSIYPKRLFNYEKSLARKLSRLRGSRSGEAMSFLEKQITTYQKKNRIILAEKQREAVKRLFFEQMLILTGGPGTGKTTVVKAMIDVFKSVYPKAQIALAAPTGRASRKLSDVTGQEAKTIHSLIGYRPGDKAEYNNDNKLPANFLVVDEVSMVDLHLMHLLLQAVENDTKILLVGDTDQLPSVSPGNVLADMIQAGIPTVRLTDVFRQAEESQIVTNAHRINKGKPLLIDTTKNDFYFIRNDQPEHIAQLIVLSVVRFMNLGYDLSDIMVLSPMKKGPVGTIVLNQMLRDTINPKTAYTNEWKIGDRVFRVGDKILQKKNNRDKDVYNGDIGIIRAIDKYFDTELNEHIQILTANFGGRNVTYKREDLDQIELGYAITIHKSQGGEAPIVIIPMTTSHYIMLARNLVYTGLTRAKEKAVFIGTDKAMNMAIANDKITKRNSRLSERIIAEIHYNDRYKENERVNEFR
ncbi:ATP-dependent RecD-like DNA helicase [Heyndrickxia sporothermodurans]|uniref:SF1B family DNA helicase RecD2 n=1 Tax=Heyndrickxia sporothermodurans TaxID=46224 RepID=UPI002DB857EC|nr:ATP-dependent RecD-like DNA helicase [Heyndrickxia sporothermodurans]MEB6549295.1 ATP-dependent RecD-like DNA helicase [Heyndrickxia sporothermodurans]